MVGCVIAREGRIIGEGFHRQFGGPHAEINAWAACGQSPAGATAYVTLEPCCHTSKKTPPCVPRLIEAKLARVVIGCVDPNPEVAGRGAAQLKSAGIQVDVMDLPRARQLIAPFFARMRLGRPYVTLKWAQSADGKVAGPGGRRVQITSGPASTAIHELRSRCDAILVGINTVLNDDPVLTVRLAESRRPLVRAVLDTHLRIPLTARLIVTGNEAAPVILFTSHSAAAEHSAKTSVLEAAGVDVRAVSQDASRRLSIPGVLGQLGSLTVTHLLVEPGPTLAAAFFTSGVWDRLWIFRSPTRIGDLTAPQAASAPGEPIARARVGVDELSEYLNPDSGAMFHAEPSADFLLATGATEAGRPA